jgi:hypothetical protein
MKREKDKSNHQAREVMANVVVVTFPFTENAAPFGESWRNGSYGDAQGA